MKKYKLHVVWAIVAVIALIGGIFWGKSMTSSTTARGGSFVLSSSTRSGFAGRGATGGATGVGLTTGQVAAIGGGSLTLQLANGNSENVFYSSSTEVIEPQPVSISAIQSGTTVMITGTQNSDGSMTASSIEVRSGNAPTGGAGQ